jgi:hypothetical protein
MAVLSASLCLMGAFLGAVVGWRWQEVEPGASTSLKTKSLCGVVQRGIHVDGITLGGAVVEWTAGLAGQCIYPRPEDRFAVDCRWRLLECVQ